MTRGSPLIAALLALVAGAGVWLAFAPRESAVAGPQVHFAEDATSRWVVLGGPGGVAQKPPSSALMQANLIPAPCFMQASPDAPPATSENTPAEEALFREIARIALSEGYPAEPLSEAAQEQLEPLIRDLVLGSGLCGAGPE